MFRLRRLLRNLCLVEVSDEVQWDVGVQGCRQLRRPRGVSATPPSEAELARADELVVCRNAFSQHDTAGRGEFTTTRPHTES